MFPSTSTTLAKTARSSRQSGLKKPRPLRSISLQEQTVSKKLPPERQLSHPSGNMLDENMIPVCEGISAMSALIAAQAESEVVSAISDNVKQPYQEKGLSYGRQDSNSSYNSCIGSESGSSFSLSRQNSFPLENITFPKCESTPKSFSHSYYPDDPKGISVDVNSNNIGFNGSNQDSSLSLSRNEEFANVPLATLLTAQGEKLILAGRNMQTILMAAKILVREMGASIISMRIEDLNADDTKSPQTKSGSVSPVERDEQAETEKKVIRYTKEDLLVLSACDQARKPPANWNILRHTHSDCCLPPDKIIEYFEAIDFHHHDGTLVMEDRRIQTRKEKEKITC